MNNANPNRLPLYEEEEIIRFLKENQQHLKEGNLGLLFDKFCFYWQKSEKGWSLDRNKSRWIERFCTKAGNKYVLKRQIERMENLVEQLKGRTLHFQTEGRFAPGLGHSNPIENGLAWHQTLGVPYLPGSSVKGILRNYLSLWEDKLENREEILREIFGDPGQAGNLIFFDALPVEPVQLQIDIMTPHYSGYYQEPKEKNPTDWDPPVPIPFLTVAPKQTYLFAFAPRNGKTGYDLDRISEWLKEALMWLGAGAKTAVGYGRFVLQEQ